MTRKDYELVACALSGARRDLLARAEGRTFQEVERIGNKGQTKTIERPLSELSDHAVLSVIDRLNAQLQVDNPGFDRGKFEAACLAK